MFYPKIQTLSTHLHIGVFCFATDTYLEASRFILVASAGSLINSIADLPHSPLHYSSKCCNDPSHIENYNSSDYEDELLECQDQQRCILSGWRLAMGLNFEMCDPTAVVNNTETMLRPRTTSSGGLLWSMAPSVYI